MKKPRIFVMIASLLVCAGANATDILEASINSALDSAGNKTISGFVLTHQRVDLSAKPTYCAKISHPRFFDPSEICLTFVPSYDRNSGAVLASQLVATKVGPQESPLTGKVREMDEQRLERHKQYVIRESLPKLDGALPLYSRQEWAGKSANIASQKGKLILNLKP